MADQEDVADAIVALLTPVFYPSGTSSPSAIGAAVKLYQGWPNSQTIEDDMKAAAPGVVHVSVWPRPGERQTMQFMGDTAWQDVTIGSPGQAAREARRQEKQFQITAWAATPLLRRAAGALIDATLAVTTRVTLQDGSQALFRFVSSANHDERQKALIYRRDVIYAVEYALVQTMAAYPIAHTEIHVQPQAALEPDAVPIGDVIVRLNP